MPLYDYHCENCGPFRDWRAMGQYGEPAECPACRRPASRAVATPALGMDWQQRKAHSINETSAHEPRVVHRRRGDPLVHDAHADLAGHHERKLARKHARDHSHEGGKHIHASNHPWMIRH